MKNVDDSQDEGEWEQWRCLATTLIEEFDVDNVVRVKVDTNEYLKFSSTLYDREVVMFFTG